MLDFFPLLSLSLERYFFCFLFDMCLKIKHNYTNVSLLDTIVSVAPLRMATHFHIHNSSIHRFLGSFHLCESVYIHTVLILCWPSFLTGHERTKRIRAEPETRNGHQLGYQTMTFSPSEIEKVLKFSVSSLQQSFSLHFTGFRLNGSDSFNRFLVDFRILHNIHRQCTKAFLKKLNIFFPHRNRFEKGFEIPTKNGIHFLCDWSKYEPFFIFSDGIQINQLFFGQFRGACRKSRARFVVLDEVTTTSNVGNCHLWSAHNQH